MIQTHDISIGGYAFKIESDAEHSLKSYIDTIRLSGGEEAGELVEDIEERIAELLIEQAGPERVVNNAMVGRVRAKIGEPEQFGGENPAEPAGSPAPSQKKVNWKNLRLFRDLDNKFLGGVCAGLSARFNIDVVVFRLAFVLLALPTIIWHNHVNVEFFVILSCMIYVVLWVCIPAAKTVEDKCKMNSEPLSIEQFKAQAVARPKDKSGTPALHLLGRVIAIAAGIMMICGGIGVLFGASLVDIFPKLMDPEDFNLQIGSYCLSDFFSVPHASLMMTISIALLGIWMLYAGIVAIFNIRTPKWRPGVWLFMLWLISLIVFFAYCIHAIVKFGVVV